MSTISQFGGEDVSQHIHETDLPALLQQRLTPLQNARLNQHLPDCRRCRELYQDANDFGLPLHADEANVSEAQIQASWRQLRPLILQAEPLVATTIAARPTALATAAGTSRSLALPLFAMLFLSLSLIAILLWRDRQAAKVPSIAAVETSTTISTPPVNQLTPSASQQASAHPQVADPKSATAQPATLASEQLLSLATYNVTTLILTSGEKGGAETMSSNSFSVPAKAKQLRFRLTKYKPTEFPSYQVELLDATRKVRQVVTGSLAKDKSIEAVFQRKGLTDGEYQLRATGQGHANGDLTPLTTDPINLSFKTN